MWLLFEDRRFERGRWNIIAVFQSHRSWQWSIPIFQHPCQKKRKEKREEKKVCDVFCPFPFRRFFKKSSSTWGSFAYIYDLLFPTEPIWAPRLAPSIAPNVTYQLFRYSYFLIQLWNNYHDQCTLHFQSTFSIYCSNFISFVFIQTCDKTNRYS